MTYMHPQQKLYDGLDKVTSILHECSPALLADILRAIDGVLAGQEDADGDSEGYHANEPMRIRMDIGAEFFGDYDAHVGGATLTDFVNGEMKKAKEG